MQDLDWLVGRERSGPTVQGPDAEEHKAAAAFERPMPSPGVVGWVDNNARLQPAPDWRQIRQRGDSILSGHASDRKGLPMTTGVLDYFPLALAEIARVSVEGNKQHNPGQPLHWAKEKSTDHADCIMRHLVDRGKFDVDGQLHSAKLAWRALALLEIELEGGQPTKENLNWPDDLILDDKVPF